MFTLGLKTLKYRIAAIHPFPPELLYRRILYTGSFLPHVEFFLCFTPAGYFAYSLKFVQTCWCFCSRMIKKFTQS